MKRKTLKEYLHDHSVVMNKARMEQLSPEKRSAIALKAGLANRKKWALLRKSLKNKRIGEIEKKVQKEDLVKWSKS